MDAEHAYLAGIVDGEGTITIHKHTQYRRKTFQLRPRVIVTNTSRLLVETLKARHGGTIIEQGSRNGNKPCFLWRVCASAEIESLIKEIKPFMLIKRRHAELMEAFILSRMIVRQQQGFAHYTDEEVAIYEKISTLNGRMPRR